MAEDTEGYLSHVPVRLRDTAELVRKGIRNPEQIPPFVLGTLFPDSRWGPEWREENGVITFVDGGFAGGSPNRPELSARIYYEVQQLRSMLPDRRYRRSLEIGCGYGRLSPWIAEYAEQSVAIEPNTRAIEQGKILHPDLSFVNTAGEHLPFADDSFDLVVTWCVLQHVPPDSIEDVADEITRVLTDDGTLLICEQTSGERGRADWPRERSTYESLFAPYSLIATDERGAEPTFTYAEHMETMTFTGPRSPRAVTAQEELVASSD